MTEIRHLTLVAYDSPCGQRRRRMAAQLARIGRRVQKSVFLAWLTETERAHLRDALSRVATGADSLVIVPVCSRCARLAHRHNAAAPPLRPRCLIA